MSQRHWDKFLISTVNFLLRRKSCLNCFAGGDVTLLYWSECFNCGTVICVDYSDESSMNERYDGCPMCDVNLDVENHPHLFYTPREQRDKKVAEMIAYEREIGLI